MNDEKFDWGPLGEGFWVDAGKTVGANPNQVRFAVCRHFGMNASRAAKAAGYTGSPEYLRQVGHRNAKSDAVLSMLSMATAQTGGGDDGVVKTAEARRILSKLARGSDPSARIRAIELLNKMDKDDDAARLRELDQPCDPQETYARLVAEIGVEAAQYLVAKINAMQPATPPRNAEYFDAAE
jgi:hypothetical protein